MKINLKSKILKTNKTQNPKLKFLDFMVKILLEIYYLDLGFLLFY